MAPPAGPSSARQTGSAANPGAAPVRWLDRVTGGLLAMVMICRLLTPTDAASVGETIWIAQLTFLALLIWSLACFRAGQVEIRFDWVDGSVLLLCLGHVAGALLIAATAGDQRAALNMLWEWCGVAATYFLMR